MNILHNKIALGVAIVALCGTAGTIAMAASYSWIPLGSVGAMWASNGIHAHNSNSGSIIIGSDTPDGDLLLDVTGPIGASEYCTGTDTDCFTAADMLWRKKSTHQYIINTGNVGIGTASTTNPSQKLEVVGNVLANSFLYNSDSRLKENVRHLSGLDIISQLQGIRFNWIADGTETIGLIAQDVEQVVPEIVFTNPDTGYKSVQYANLVAPLIQAINEQQQTIQQMQREIDTLKQHIQ